MAFATFTGVNDTALHVAVSEFIIERLVQESLYRDKLGITEITIKDVGAGGVRVGKVKPSVGTWRKLGETTNGGWFNSEGHKVVGLDEEFIEFLYQYDEGEDVPVTQERLSLGGISKVEARAKEIGKNIAIGLNAGTMAHQIGAVVNAVITAAEQEGKIYTYTPATDGDSLEKFVSINAQLDNGDGVYHAYFPRSGRIALLRPKTIANLRRKGAVIVGGSNYAQELLSSGAIDIDVKVLPEVHNGYVGMLDGIPTYKATDMLWAQAEKWLGVAPGYLDNVVGIVCSDLSTGRGHAFPDQTKVIDSPNGQGLRIQPLSNFGVKVFFETGIKLLADATFVEGTSALSVLPEGSQA
jgi:hypothetical protein